MLYQKTNQISRISISTKNMSKCPTFNKNWLILEWYFELYPCHFFHSLLLLQLFYLFQQFKDKWALKSIWKSTNNATETAGFISNIKFAVNRDFYGTFFILQFIIYFFQFFVQYDEDEWNFWNYVWPLKTSVERVSLKCQHY